MIQDLISIIVPVYKVEPYLRRCVESILGQTHREIELFLIDDGSPDNCGAICDEYARADSRVTVIHTENVGVYTARKMALKVATGEYIMFVDSDDWVEPDYCETALRLAYENNVQMVAFMYNYVFEGVVDKRPTHFSKTGIMEASEAVRHLILRDSPIANFLWNKLYKRSLFDGYNFPEGKVLLDQAVVYNMMLRAGRIYVSDAVLYNYLQRPSSIGGGMYYSLKMYSSLFAIWNERLPILRQYCPENERHQMMQLAYLSVSGLLYMRPGSETEQIRNEMREFLSVNKDYLLNGGGKSSTSVKLYLYYYCRPLLYLIKYVTVVWRAMKHYFKQHIGHYD